MLKFLYCLLVGHDYNKEFFRAHVYEYWNKDKTHKDKYYRNHDAISADLNESEYWCRRCQRYRKLI